MIIHFSNNTNNQARPIGAKNWIKRIQPVFHSMLSPRYLNECFNAALHMRAGNGISFNSVLYYTRLDTLSATNISHGRVLTRTNGGALANSSVA